MDLQFLAYLYRHAARQNLERQQAFMRLCKDVFKTKVLIFLKGSLLFDTALEEALAQIKDKGYAAKYIGSGKTILHAAFAFLGRDDIEMRM